MLTKQALMGEFSRKWKNHYQVELFRQKGFIRKQCPHCKNHFWTLDQDRKTCGSPPCDNYGFLGSPITKVKWDYVKTWKMFEKFFKDNGHASVPRYPVIDRWRPDLYFTIASIQDFQRIDSGNVVMEYPADPLVVPQVCLRFNDIDNVGVTGRHHTSFVMSGQHSFGNYWKDRTIELNFRFITDVMGVPEHEITYLEDVWSMPDFSQFGPSLETFSRGLELVNSVFSQFTASGSGYKELPKKVVDVGWGHERIAWFTNGTTTGYDTVFEPVLRWMRKRTGIKETSVFTKYSSLAGSLTTDEVKDMAKMRKKVADGIGISVKELNEIVEPMQAMYAIADHSKTLLFAVTDGGIPSNVGGGYNLRVLLRRSLAFIEDHGFDFTLSDVAELHAKQLKSMFPELKDGIRPLEKVLDVEKKRYISTSKKAASIVRKELSRGISEDTLVRLYTSNGVSPEDVQKMAAEQGKHVRIPEDFYSRIAEQHMAGGRESVKELKLDVSGMKPTGRMYYERPYKKEFKASVSRAAGDWVALDKTCFYPEGGGQPADNGIIISGDRKMEVKDVQKVGEIIFHKLPGSGLKAGDRVEGRIDWERRYAMMKMHTSTHVLAGVARKVIGGHVWQAGAQKARDSTRLDLTHYERFTQEELDEVEKEVNRVIRKGLEVDARFYPRKEAEMKYGFVLYQGGASPGKDVRVVSIKGLDVEACGGTHLRNTSEIGTFRIIRSERIQDGVNRIVFTTADSAEKYEREEKDLYRDCLENMSSLSDHIRDLKPSDVSKELAEAAEVFSVEPAVLPQTISKFILETENYRKSISGIGADMNLKIENEVPMKEKPRNLAHACRQLFDFWKAQRKEMERMVREKAKHMADMLASKAENNHVFEVVDAGRKEMIEVVNDLLEKDPMLTVILANQAGDIVGMSGTEDMAKKIAEICKNAGGSGGGKKEFAQGRADLSKLLKLKERM